MGEVEEKYEIYEPLSNDPKKAIKDLVRQLNEQLDRMAQKTADKASVGASDWTYISEIETTSEAVIALTSSLPSSINEIEIFFDGVSTDAAAEPPIVQLGDREGFDTTGYESFVTRDSGAGGATESDTDGLYTMPTVLYEAAEGVSGVMRLVRWATSHLWFASGNFDEGTNSIYMNGLKELSYVLTSIRITTPTGTDAFDAGKVILRYK